MLMAEVYGGVGEPDQPPPSGHLRLDPADDLTPAGESVTRADAGGLQACYASTDGWCTALYDVDTSGAVDLTDVTRFAAQTALRDLPDPIQIDPFQSRFDNPFLWTGQRYDFTTQLYHFWARSYDPQTGRFLQEDMQGVLSVLDLFVGGMGLSPFVHAPLTLARGEYPDVLNLFAYLASNPTHGIDPFGLYEDEVDELIGDWTGQRLYAIGALNEGAKWASIGLNVALQLAWSLVPGSGLYDAFQSVEVIKNGKGGFWDAVNIATAAFPLAKGISKLIGFKALFKARNYRFRACNCFVAGTLVATPTGPAPIQSLSIGDEVWTRTEADAGAIPHVSLVSRTFVDVAQEVVWVTLSNGETFGATCSHEVWTNEDGWTTVGSVELGDTLVGVDGAPIGIVALDWEDVSTPVYNFEVDGTFTYFVHGVWVHNNSCPRVLNTARKHGGDLHTAAIQQRISELDGAAEVRMNQTLVSPTKGKMTDLRPDIQYVGPDGKVYIEEVVHTNAPSPTREADFRKLLGEEFGGYAEWDATVILEGY